MASDSPHCNFFVYFPVSVLIFFVPTNIVFSQDPAPTLDRIELRQGLTVRTSVDVWNPLKTLQREGEILSFNATSLVLKVVKSDGSEDSQTFSSEQVQGVEPSWRGAGTAAAIRLFEQRKFHEFLDSLQKIGEQKTKIPDWQSALITSMLVQASEANGRVNSAGDTFITLASSYPIPPLIYGDMPLCWTVTSVDASASAKKWIQQDNEAARLLGASWLLLGPEASQAKSVLTELQKSKSPVIVQLAKAQSWRLVPVPDTMAQLNSWIAERDRMLRPLALGPSEFISDRLMRIGEYDLAIGQAFQIATLYSNRHHRVRIALVSVAEMLKKQGRSADAEKVVARIKQLDGEN